MLITILSVPPTINSKKHVNSLSVFDLAFDFINRNYTSIDDATKVYIIKEIREVLIHGVTYKDINTKIQICPCVDQDYKKYFRSIKATSTNLIDPQLFYYHNQLRVFPDAPVRTLNPNTGIIDKKEFEYFLEIKASYTVDDLIEYLGSKQSLANVASNRSKLIGGLKFLLTKYDADFLLFLIDSLCISYDNQKRKAKNIFEIEDFIEEAKFNHNMKLSESAINGTNKITPRKRKLFCAT